MRGDISFIAKRFNKANNKYMQFCDNSESRKYITYDWAMSQYLPYSGFKWLKNRN